MQDVSEGDASGSLPNGSSRVLCRRFSPPFWLIAWDSNPDQKRQRMNGQIVLSTIATFQTG